MSIKVLHVGVNAGTESLPKYFRQKCDYEEILLDGYTRDNLNSIDYIPDIVFLQIQGDTIAGRYNTCQFIGDQIMYFKSQGSTVINWTGDKRDGVPRWMIEFAKNVTYTGFSNEEDMNQMAKYSNSVFIQQGIDLNIYRPDGEKMNVPEVVFMANRHTHFPLSQYRKQAANALKAELGSRFGLYGNGWQQSNGNFNHNQYEEAKAYRGAKIGISISHYNSDRYFSDRLGRALCSGVCVLSHHYDGIEKDFKVGVHLDSFHSITELVEKSKYYLEHEEERLKIAKAGLEHAREILSYEKMVDEIIKLK